jgi:hypothetical protein
MGAPAVSSDTGGSANVMYRTAESTPLVLSGPPSEGDVVVVEVSRAATDPADTLAVDARLHGVALFYVTTSGSDA